jgi:hypothetical protein
VYAPGPDEEEELSELANTLLFLPNTISVTYTFTDVSSGTKLEVLTAALLVHDTVSLGK